jgi:hypothetical protein
MKAITISVMGYGEHFFGIKMVTYNEEDKEESGAFLSINPASWRYSD